MAIKVPAMINGDKIVLTLSDPQHIFSIDMPVAVAYFENLWGMKISRDGDGWLIEKDKVCLRSPTPLFYHVGLTDFEDRYERLSTIVEGDTVLDVGACIGDTTVPMAMKAKGGKVIAIEPDPVNIAFLKRNLEGYPNATIIGKAVASKKGMMPLYQHGILTGHSLVPNMECPKHIMVEADTLDNLLGDEQIDFAKIDVMRAEATILEGASRFLSTVRKLAVKTYPAFDLEENHVKVQAIFKEYDFKVVFYARDVGVVYASRD